MLRTVKRAKMKRIAIVTPCILPVPATEGGAVEELITRIIKDNELNNDIVLDVYSVLDESDGVGKNELLKTNVIGIEYNKKLRFEDRVLDKIHRSIKNYNSFRLFDKSIVNTFEERLAALGEPYFAVIVENQVSIAKRVVSVCRGKYEFPVFFHMHNDVDIYRSPQGIHELAAMGVQFIAVSNYIKGQILSCAKDAVVHLLYNGTDLNDRAVNTKVDKRNICGDEICFLYAGRVIPDKGVLELVESFERLLDKLPKEEQDRFKLDIIGFSNEPTRYEKRVKALADRRKDRITCKKRISTADMDLKYNEYDIVVMPTMNEEPFGLVALETMSKGIPLITTNSGALPEVVGDGAVIVNRSGSFTDDLAGAMLRLAKNKEIREELGKRAYERSREVPAFDIKNYYSNFVKIIDKKIDDDKISIVVPVYNVFEYLNRCVRSLLEQTYSNLEIILIDDGSTDGSGGLCDELASSDPRIKVIHQKNAGLSGARNTGLDNASGEYIFFCDSDDFLDRDALHHMHDKICMDGADIVACGFSNVWDDYARTGREEVITDGRPGTWSGNEASVQMMMSNNVCTVVWNKLYKRTLFDGIRFPKGVFHEDEATTYKLLFRSKVVSYTPAPFYKYYQRSAGIMAGGLLGRYEDLITALRDRTDFYKEQGDSRLEQYSWVSFLERIKYCYRNVDSIQDQKKLVSIYGDCVSWDNAPDILGGKKKLALWLWKYIKY